ncbi:hypothetical protein KGG72_gp66 [Streptomyces phage Salutena]|uniref:DUF7417 domain-containing protein n=1 Tax=Streptomyces phage Salutena TaxID=2767576 RepID=A0A7S6U336_9CAUD|nr:hypothetical protein KGG72_gp66 [Streptomyces phage Salutena]QOV06196.1 hypothetical protein CPT_Salutena_066 [Streptomyces phage Salutena]
MGRMKDIAIDLISYEQGELDPAETLDLFGLLVKSGMAWTLQGSYGRTANELIHAGYLTRDGDVTEFAESMLAELEAA